MAEAAFLSLGTRFADDRIDKCKRLRSVQPLFCEKLVKKKPDCAILGLLISPEKVIEGEKSGYS